MLQALFLFRNFDTKPKESGKLAVIAFQKRVSYNRDIKETDIDKEGVNDGNLK